MMFTVRGYIALAAVLCLSLCPIAARSDTLYPAADTEAVAEEPEAADDAESAEPKPSEAETETETEPEPKFIRVENIHVSLKLSEGCLFPGQSARATAGVKPKNATAPGLEWSSSAPRLVSVDEDGVLTVNPDARVDESGEYVDIWAKATDGSFAMNCTTVRVMPALKKLNFLTDGITVYTGDKNREASLPIEITPARLSGHAQILWESSDPEIVSVSPGGAGGEVAMISWGDHPGRALIKAYAEGGQGLGDELLVRVLDSASSILIDETAALLRGEERMMTARAKNARGMDMENALLVWSLASPMPGVSISREGLIRVDRHCAADSVIVGCRAQEGGALAFATLRIEDIHPMDRFSGADE